MTTVTIYHNPRCSKSRQTLALLEENNADINTVLYLDNPPSADDLTNIISLLGVSAMDIIRTGEDEFSEAGIGRDSSEEEVIGAILKTPKLLQRPIVVANSKAVIGRPPENVLDLL